MSIPSWVDILHLQARQKEEEGQAPDFTFTDALTSLLQERKARASFSPDVCETSPVVSLTLFSIQPRISSATNTHGATSAASSKAYSPQSKHLWRFFSWTPPQSLGQLQVCWERPIGNKPEAWATTQPDSPGWKPEIPGEIHTLDFFFVGPFEWPLQTTNHPGTMWLHFSRASPWHSAPWRASTETVTALPLYRTCHGCFQLVTWLHGLPEHLVFSVTPLFFVSWVCLPQGDLRQVYSWTLLPKWGGKSPFMGLVRTLRWVDTIHMLLLSW